MLALAGLLGSFVLLAGAAPPALTGGTGTLYIGGWPNKIFVIDEGTEGGLGSAGDASSSAG